MIGRGPLRRHLVPENIVVERYRFRLGCHAEFAPQHVLADPELPYGLVGCAHLRVQADESAVDRFPGGILPERRAELIGCLVAGTAILEGFGQVIWVQGNPSSSACPKAPAAAA